MNIADRIMRAIANRRDAVFLRGEFETFGSPAQVGRALSKLTSSGTLVRLGLGVYAKTKASVLSGNPIPVMPLEVLAPLALNKLGIDVAPSRLARTYNDRLSSQVPSGIVLNTGRRRIVRKLSFNGKRVLYERT